MEYTDIINDPWQRLSVVGSPTGNLQLQVESEHESAFVDINKAEAERLKLKLDEFINLDS